jgi:hypothetical protein
MIILNYSHPLTVDQLAQIDELIDQYIDKVCEIASQFDQGEPFAPQIEALIKASELTSKEWQTLPLLIVPPALSSIAVALLATLHGLMGYFPDCVRLRMVDGSRPPRFEVAEILSLQDYRKAGRGRRAETK